MSIANGLVLPNQISNGNALDATVVMANYNALLAALNRALLDAGSGSGMNASGSQIHNLGAGTVSTDAVNLSQITGLWLPLTGGTMTGVLAATAGLTAPTVTTGDNSTNAATTAFVQAQLAVSLANLASVYAPLASPALTGTPTAPTAAAGTNTPQIATMAAIYTAVGAAQSVQNMLGSRAVNTVYTNSESAPIEVMVWFGSSGSGATMNAYVGGVQVAFNLLNSNLNNLGNTTTFRVPAGATYEVTVSGTATLGGWTELR